MSEKTIKVSWDNFRGEGVSEETITSAESLVVKALNELAGNSNEFDPTPELIQQLMQVAIEEVERMQRGTGLN